MPLSKFLNSIGLEQNAQKVYLALLGFGDAPCSRIAKKAEIKRTTAYNVLENLIKQGLVSSYKERGVRRFVAESPSKIRNTLEAKIFTLEKYLPKLQSFYNIARTPMPIRFFEGEEGIKQISEEVLNNKEKIIYSFGSIKDVKQAIGSSISFSKRRQAKKIFHKSLRTRDDKFRPGYLENQEKQLKEVRFLPDDVKIPEMVYLFDNKVGVISPKKEGTGFIIESDGFFQAVKALFDIAWSISQSTSKK